MNTSLRVAGWGTLGFAIAFVVTGGFLSLRWRWLPLAHLPALAWGIWIELSGGICPLTPLENRLRAEAGEAGYGGGFVANYLVPLIYPPGLTSSTQWALGAGLVAVNLIAYALYLRAVRRGRPGLGGTDR